MERDAWLYFLRSSEFGKWPFLMLSLSSPGLLARLADFSCAMVPRLTRKKISGIKRDIRPDTTIDWRRGEREQYYGTVVTL